MKCTILLFLTIVSVSYSWGQGQAGKGNGKISGTVIDSSNDQVVEFATVALTDPATDKPIDGSVCDDKGKFTISKVPNGTYKLVFSFIGYENLVIDKVTITDKKNSIDVGTVKMTSASQELDAVTIEGERAIIEEKVDRTVYNAENDATAKGGDATDVLKRVPMLSVDMDGNVSLRGNQNIRVLINNKPSTITASSVADALKQIPADQIKSVEVITSPSAKYDAEGSAGIINIITKKNTLQGFTLGVDAGAGYRGSNLGLNGNYRNKNMGFSLGGFSRAGYNVTGKYSNSQLTTLNGIESLNVQEADTRRQDLFGNLNFGWDYDISKTNSLAASVRYGTRNGFNYQDNLTTQSYQADVLTSSSLRNVEVDDQSHNIDASLTYTHLFSKPQREFSILTQYSRNNRNNDFVNTIMNESTLAPTSKLKNDNQSYNEEITIQADYQTPIGTKQLVEFGGKNIYRNVSSDYKYFQATPPDWTYVVSTNSNFANIFTYKQNISAGYLSYTYAAKSGYSFKAGGRYEYTTIDANFAAEKGPVVIPSYGVFVPSVNLSKRLKNNNTLKLAYNRRIQRPSIQFLNPNVQASNPYNITIGNPNLEPEYTNNYELSYSMFIKGTSLNFSTFVRNTDDAIQSIKTVLGNDPSNPDTVRTDYQNIGKEDAYGGSLFASVNIASKLTLNGGGDVYYAVLDNKNPDPLFSAKNQGWVVSYRFFGNYAFAKKWGLQFFSFFRGRNVQLQGIQGSFYSYAMSIRRELGDKRGSIGIGFDQFLTPTMRITSYTSSPTIEQNSVTELHNFNVRVTFSYRIGKMSFDAPRRRRKSIDNDDLKQGVDGGGGADAQQGQGATGGGAGGGGAAGGGGGAFAAGAAGQRQGGGQATVAQPKVTEPQSTEATVAKVEQQGKSDSTIVVKPEGTWSYTVESPQGGGGILVINKVGNTYSGTIKNNRTNREIALTSVISKGNELTYTYEVTFGGNKSSITTTSIVEGDTMTGTVVMGRFGTFPVKATRNP